MNCSHISVTSATVYFHLEQQIYHFTSFLCNNYNAMVDLHSVAMVTNGDCDTMVHIICHLTSHPLIQLLLVSVSLSLPAFVLAVLV